jgi:hypothetical protein
MSYKVSSWTKQRLKGALGIVVNLENDLKPVIERLQKEKKENPELQEIYQKILRWKKKILDKFQMMESEITKDVIEMNL